MEHKQQDAIDARDASLVMREKRMLAMDKKLDTIALKTKALVDENATLRSILENLRESGMGWSCPHCNKPTAEDPVERMCEYCAELRPCYEWCVGEANPRSDIQCQSPKCHTDICDGCVVVCVMCQRDFCGECVEKLPSGDYKCSKCETPWPSCDDDDNVDVTTTKGRGEGKKKRIRLDAPIE